MGKLSVIATPIGNLEDITLRALRTLKECDAVYAEDTRVASKLLSHYEIHKPVFRLDAAMETKKTGEIIARLAAGEHLALVSDAGTPGVSDPGARLLAAVRSSRASPGAGITIEAIPGPSAVTAALSVAGVDTADGFAFLGFLPHKKGRQTALKDLARSEIPVVLYESPHRVMKLLAELEDIGIPRITVARELTKFHEEVVSGAPSELEAYFKTHSARGEFVVIINP